MKKGLKILLITLILVGSSATASFLLMNRPGVKRKSVSKKIEIPVTTEILKAEKHPVVIESMGTVVPEREISMTPEVSGKIIWVNKNLVAGKFFKKGELMFKLDPTDYRLVVEQRKNDVASAKLNLELENGRQVVAEKEFKMVAGKVSKRELDLILRKPHLEAAESALASAKAALRKSYVDLKRTEIRSPFNGVILEKLVDIGSSVSQSIPLVKIIGTDNFRISLSVPSESLSRIKLPQADIKGSSVKLFWNSPSSKKYREAQVISSSPQVGKKIKMAEVIAEIKDPFSLNEKNGEYPPLLAGMYLRAEIEGAFIDNSVAIKRDHLKEGNVIHLFSKNRDLVIKPVDVLHRSRDIILISGEDLAGKSHIVTEIHNPAPGLKLSLIEENENRYTSIRPAHGKREEK